MNRATATTPTPEAHAVTGVFARLVRHLRARRLAARNDRELAAILAGHRGPTIREEVLAVMDR